MEFDNFYLHNFYYLSNGDYNLFLERLKSILKYSLMSYNYFCKSTNQTIYIQNYTNKTRGYSRDYISLVDMKEVFNMKTINLDILNFISSGAFIMLKRDYIDSKLNESFNKSMFDKPAAIKRQFIKKYLSEIDYDNLIENGLEYVLPGEIKVKDYIPIDEICGIIFEENYLLYENIDMEIIKKILIETNMEYISLYSVNLSDVELSKKLNKFKLKKL